MAKNLVYVFSLFLGSAAVGETRSVFLETDQGQRVHIAVLNIDEQGTYTVEMTEEPFFDHFLSMRPFRCLEGPTKNWCHVPYPYDIERNISVELTDLEYDFLFVWKDKTDYGINMWNGVYYKLVEENGRFNGELNEIDMDTLATPPVEGDLRPVATTDLHKSDPDSHWLPYLVIE